MAAWRAKQCTRVCQSAWVAQDGAGSSRGSSGGGASAPSGPRIAPPECPAPHQKSRLLQRQPARRCALPQVRPQRRRPCCWVRRRRRAGRSVLCKLRSMAACPAAAALHGAACDPGERRLPLRLLLPWPPRRVYFHRLLPTRRCCLQEALWARLGRRRPHRHPVQLRAPEKHRHPPPAEPCLEWRLPPS